MTTANGTVNILMGIQSVDGISTSLKLIERNIIVISLDPSKTKNYIGDTPIYGVER